MLTIFCSPKPFVGETAWNQINALRSWKAIHPNVEIIIFGAPDGAMEAAEEVNAKLVPEIECSPSSAPSFNGMASYVDQHGKYDLQVYVNCDIIMNTTLLKAMQNASHRFKKFLLVGERLDLARAINIDVRETNWIASLSLLAEKEKLIVHGPTGADYFGFIRGTWNELPPVFMGRAMCDQALLHFCFRRQIPVIDGALSVVAVHQFHNYNHLSGGRQQVFNGEELVVMRKAHGLSHSLPTVADSGWRFVGSNIVPTDSKRRRQIRKIELAVRYQLRLEPLALALRGFQYLKGKSGVIPISLPLKSIISSWQESSLGTDDV